MSRPNQTEPSAAELITNLSEQTSRLVRDELKLARAEMTESAKKGGMGAGLFGAAGILAGYGFAALVATAIIALALAVPAWLAGVIVTAVLFAAAGVAALVGKKKVDDMSLTPDRTIDNVEKDIAEVKDSAHRDHA